MVSITVGGKEYPLALTVQAFSDISDLCPGKDFDRINEINQLPTGDLAKVSIKILAALSTGAEEQRAFSDPAYEKQPLNTKELLNMPVKEYLSLCQGGILAIIAKAMGGETVEVEPAKKKEKAAK